MSCNRELYEIRLRVFFPPQGRTAVDYYEIYVLGIEKLRGGKGEDFACFKPLFVAILLMKRFRAQFRPDPPDVPFSVLGPPAQAHSAHFGRLLNASKNNEVLPAALLYLKRRDIVDDTGLPSRIGVHMQDVRVSDPMHTQLTLSAESANLVGPW